jgi:hypothetical protein
MFVEVSHLGTPSHKPTGYLLLQLFNASDVGDDELFRLVPQFDTSTFVLRSALHWQAFFATSKKDPVLLSLEQLGEIGCEACPFSFSCSADWSSGPWYVITSNTHCCCCIGYLFGVGKAGSDASLWDPSVVELLDAFPRSLHASVAAKPPSVSTSESVAVIELASPVRTVPRRVFLPDVSKSRFAPPPGSTAAAAQSATKDSAPGSEVTAAVAGVHSAAASAAGAEEAVVPPHLANLMTILDLFSGAFLQT